MKLYEAVANYLADERAGRPLFGLMGDANLTFLGLYEDRHGGSYISAALEGGAVSMADGWARATGEVGVATVTHGPALTNTLTALAEAVRARTALVLLAGSPPDVNGHFQYTDIEGFAKFAGAVFVKVRKDRELLPMLDKAFAHAATASTPVVIDIPFDLMRNEVDYRAPKLPDRAGARPRPDADSVDEALARLVSAKRPLIVAGRGAVSSGARTETFITSITQTNSRGVLGCADGDPRAGPGDQCARHDDAAGQRLVRRRAGEPWHPRDAVDPGGHRLHGRR